MADAGSDLPSLQRRHLHRAGSPFQQLGRDHAAGKSPRHTRRPTCRPLARPEAIVALVATCLLVVAYLVLYTVSDLRPDRSSSGRLTDSSFEPGAVVQLVGTTSALAGELRMQLQEARRTVCKRTQNRSTLGDRDREPSGVSVIGVAKSLCDRVGSGVPKPGDEDEHVLVIDVRSPTSIPSPTQQDAMGSASPAGAARRASVPTWDVRCSRSRCGCRCR